jgi:membrane protein
VKDISPLSPEARRRQMAKARARIQGHIDQVKPGTRPFEVAKRVVIGTYNDGFIHAGNLAFMSLLTLFPFFIVLAALASLFGRTADGQYAVSLFLQTVPPGVAEVLAKPISDVLTQRSGALLWLGAAVGLWTTASFIETLREILRRAYGTRHERPFYHYRLLSMAIIVGSVLLALIAFAAQVVLTGAEQFINTLLPLMEPTARTISLSRLIPAAALFLAMYLMFYSLTPHRYRVSSCPKWPGALLVTVWWLATTALLPVVLSMLGSYDLTYGSLAGVMIALMFFFVIGLGVVLGAELNAALAESPETGIKDADREAVETKEHL